MKIKNKVSAKLLGIAMLSMTFLFSNCTKEQDLLTPITDESLDVDLTDSLDKLSITASEVSSDYYNIARALPKGYVKDGSRDYTSYIQSALNKYSQIVFPGFPIMVNYKGLTIPSNRRIIFTEGSQLRLKPTSRGNYMILRIVNVSNVTISNPYIIGDRYQHTGTSGEWGNGIGIYGSTNINISKARVINCWGDGIYIGKSQGRVNKDIRLFKPYCKSNRRDGISVVDVNGLEMIAPYTGFSDGTAPFCGINIEPNDHTNEIKNVQISDPVTEKNKGNGIQIGLGKMYGGNSKSVSISISNHTDKGSAVALKSTCRTTFRRGSEVVAGTLYVKGSDWQRNSNKPLDIYFPQSSMKLSLTEPRVMTTSGSYLSVSRMKDILEDRKAIWDPTVYTLRY